MEAVALETGNPNVGLITLDAARYPKLSVPWLKGETEGNTLRLSRHGRQGK